MTKAISRALSQWTMRWKFFCQRTCREDCRDCLVDLLRETYPIQQLVEPRIIAKAVESRIGFQHREMRLSFRKSGFEFCECSVRIAKHRKKHRYDIRRKHHGPVRTRHGH